MFSRIHSLNFHRKFHWFCATQQVAFSFFEKKKSIYSPPSLPLFVPARCSVSLARHGKPRNDFNHVNEIAWNFFSRGRGGEGIYYSWTAESFAENRFTSGTQSRSRWNIRADYCSIWLIFSHDKLTVLSRDPGIIRSFSTILIIIRFILIKRLRYFSLSLSFGFATKKRNDARLLSVKYI